MSDKKVLISALVVVGLLLAGTLYYVFKSSKESPTASQSQPIAIPTQKPAPEPTPQPSPEPATPPTTTPGSTASATGDVAEGDKASAKPSFVLPRLDDSDQLIRDGVVSLTRNEGINGWLGANELIRKCVVFIDNAAHGGVARQQVRFLAPSSEFKAKQLSEDEYELDPRSYDRYDKVTQIFTSIDSRRAAEFYELLRPLFNKAYAELGYPDRNFDKVIFEAVGRLLETPVITHPIKLVRPAVMYRFEDPKLESLSAVQKQLIRMGPKNTQAIKAKLSDMAAELRAVLKR